MKGGLVLNLLFVKKRKQLVVKTSVNASYFGKGANKVVKRLLIEEILEEHIAHVIPPEWHGARWFTLKVFRLADSCDVGRAFAGFRM